MTVPAAFPFYLEGNHQTNEAYVQVSQLVRSGPDARRLHVPIRDLAEAEEKSDLADEIEQILLVWDDPSFADRADRALTLLGELDDRFTYDSHAAVDMMSLGEIRVPLNALVDAICRRRDELKAGRPAGT